MRPEPVVSGAGVITAIGQGKAAFLEALLQGRHAFGVMQRPGRQCNTAFLGAEIANVAVPAGVARQLLRTASLSAQAALTVLDELWLEAGLPEVDPRRIGLVVGGSNVQQREQVLVHDSYRDRVDYLRPTYALTFMDSDLCGICTAHFGIRGAAFTVGGASASGQVALIQAAHMVLSGQVDVCIALGALMDLSYWECQGFRSLGAMGSERHAANPAGACRPFDRDRDGFIFGESCGAVAIESAESAARRGVKPYASLRGAGMVMDGNRNPDPSLEGEVRAIESALAAADWASSAVDYVNPHGTGSGIGDETELAALRASGLGHARLNATKSLIGHGLSSAGIVEVIATLLQMQAGVLHPTRNLENPIDPSFNWVRGQKVECTAERALTLSMGFGGINTALCWQRHQK